VQLSEDVAPDRGVGDIGGIFEDAVGHVYHSLCLIFLSEKTVSPLLRIISQ
jgi:hypothetical protein